MIAPGTWSVDPAGSRVEFAVKHMLLATLRGRFGEFEGTLAVGPDGVATALGSVEAGSIETDESVRDEHLRRSADFFDVERFPRIEFRSTRIEEPRDGQLRIVGELTMRGLTHEIVLDGGAREARRDGAARRVELELKGELNRKEFGLTWNQALDSGGMLIGNTVRITLTISALSPAVAAASVTA